MPSDFSAARVHLERAQHYLGGNDEISRKACEALDLLMEAVVSAHCQQQKAKVLLFRKR